ncbi:hypothetical protein KSP40_PGU012547 [Platanthera guangdongensis]|uniref:Uncharacterized protein n=1 Tax=Platanthera guangdongensis TaxID=2320717 RepID=A0ABR2M678_9ASPA
MSIRRNGRPEIFFCRFQNPAAQNLTMEISSSFLLQHPCLHPGRHDEQVHRWGEYLVVVVDDFEGVPRRPHQPPEVAFLPPILEGPHESMFEAFRGRRFDATHWRLNINELGEVYHSEGIYLGETLLYSLTLSSILVCLLLRLTLLRRCSYSHSLARTSPPGEGSHAVASGFDKPACQC